MAAVFALAFACWFLLKRILSDHEKDRQLWQNVLNKTELNLIKLVDAVSELTICLKTHDVNDSQQHQRILDAVNRSEHSS